MSLQEDLLTVDHRELDHLFDRTLTCIDASDVVAAYRSLDLFWARLAVHIRAEHLRLFPAVAETARAFGKTSVLTTIDRLHSDHDLFMRELGRAVKAMRLVFYWGNESETLITVRGLLERVGERLVEHNQIEEENIYPMARQPNVSPAVENELWAVIRREVENMPPRFRSPSSK